MHIEPSIGQSYKNLSGEGSLVNLRLKITSSLDLNVNWPIQIGYTR